MDLFDQMDHALHNLLPADGLVHYHGPLVCSATAELYLARLLHQVDWQHDAALIFGKRITTKRKVAWYADAAFSYTYSGITRTALPWLPVLAELKALVELHSGERYNACLLNLYHDGSEGMAWHSDAEKDLKRNGAIASLSFGALRKFSFKHKVSGQRVSVLLEPGSLLVMKGETQSHWLHRLPPSRTVSAPRINLTFRTMATETEKPGNPESEQKF